MNRRTLLFMSIAVSLILHVVLVVIAPQVHLLRATAARSDVEQLFNIQLMEEELPLPVPEQNDGGADPLSTRPGSLEDLLDMATDPLDDLAASLTEEADIPDLAERLADENLEREHDLTMEADALDRVDAKVLEIAEDVARQDIQVARRMVAPSDARILPEGAMPSLSAGDDDLVDDLLMIQPLPGTFGTGNVGPPEAEEGAEESPMVEEDPLMPEPEPIVEKGLPELPVEEIVETSPVVAAVRDEQAYEFLDDLVDIHVESYAPPGEDQGYFRLRIVPKDGESIAAIPKDVTFVVDASNSIIQRKLNETARGIRESVAMLRDQDRFNIVVFRDRATYFEAQLTQATPDVKRAADVFLRDLKSFGETDVYKAIAPVVQKEPRPGVPHIVMVFSDGRPTTGVKDGRDIINGLTEENTSGNTIYAFGGGRTVNRYLLDLLAYRNKGESRVTPQVDGIDQELPRFFATVNDPILTDCMVDFGSINETEVYPKDTPDFFNGQAVTVYGRFDPENDKDFAIRLTGRAGERKKEVIFRADLENAETGDQTVARNWAFRKVYHLIGEICRVGETPELMAELQTLSQAYGIRTSYDE
jgi:hypothetical protein